MTTVNHGSYVGGIWVRNGETFTNTNPADPENPLCEIYAATNSEITNAFLSANQASHSWRKTPAPLRSDFLLRIAQKIEDRAERIALDMTLEEGKTLLEAKQETMNAAAQFRYAAAIALQPDGATVQARDPKTALLFSRCEPLGVVVCITPWNFPISIPAWKISHALAFGNTVVWKPAELTPLTSIHLAEAIEESELPQGVMNMILGFGSKIGDHLLSHSQISGVSFTGSNEVGRSIGLAMAQNGIPTQLELGGSNPAIVLKDADLSVAAEEIAKGAYLSSGQKCTATTRVIVDDSIHDELLERLTSLATSWKVGNPLLTDTMIGPLASRSQFDRLVTRLRSLESNRVTGSSELEPDHNGYFLHPYIFTKILEDHEIFRKEIFGPVICIIQGKNYEDCLRIANDTEFGLSASLFTTDLNQAMHFAAESEAGVVKINKSTTGNEIHVPFGGHKQSGSGSSEMGWAAKEFFTRWKTVYVGK
jgi:acyl-CoA reductase-like NAD-dependent aldehyde dehydrogenase